MRTTFANSFNVDLLDENYARWKQDPDSVDSEWSAFFEGFELGSVRKTNGTAQLAKDVPAAGGQLPLQERIENLVGAYRTLGHTIARLDPLSLERPDQPLLSLRELGFSEEDMDLMVSSRSFAQGKIMKLREMIDELRRIYSHTIGLEYMHILNPRVRDWIRERVESRPPDFGLSRKTKQVILQELMEAESFERFLHTRYVGQKRFGLEGGESLMVILNGLLVDCSIHGVQDIVMGMAHRGRLNVIANFLKKSLPSTFAQFSENYIPDLVAGDGDVKYHLGYQTRRATESGYEVGIRLAGNPSHLEAVDPVVLGMARARQRIVGDSFERRKVLPLLIHGDAAFAGQGIVAEVMNLSQLQGYKVGGTIHVVVNNQIGFTTLPADARSSYYATDVAKMIEAPVFHVNGDDPLAVAFVTSLAFAFRQQFHSDVVIDMYCYRRHGHNEGDEPLFTQPSLYAEINAHPSVVTIFKKNLVDTGVLTEEQTVAMEKEFVALYEAALEEVKEAEKQAGKGKKVRFSESNAVFQAPYSHKPVDTSVSKERIETIVRALTNVPADFNVLPKVKRMLLDRRAQIYQDGGPFDWSYAESLAFGSLLLEGVPVRLSGQDSRRGTFSQRHSVIYDAKTRERYIPLWNLSRDQARFCVYNSLLSEAAVLGFDYGYSLDFPVMLCLWEAQFGDFANGAQVIIDQFIASAESKWQRPNGIVLLLPHGYEGQGPEHSSGRLERFLQLCAEDNIQVCNLTTPAQYFHVLRRQMMRKFRKPLIIMTPKSLLRAGHCVSTLDDFTRGRFVEILPAPLLDKPEKIDRVVLCTGKVYYDLLHFRDAQKLGNAAIIRLEQLYPLDEPSLSRELARFSPKAKLVWCQEEPQNMGAWSFIYLVLDRMHEHQRPVWYAGRDAGASPAVGALAMHKREQKFLIELAFNI
jgi:2-oxoglutarate dehydrogenase E1 component